MGSVNLEKLMADEMTTDDPNNDMTTVEPFRLVKFFSVTGLLVFILFVPVFTGLIANNTNRVMLERSEAYAQVFARNINRQVFQQFVVPTILTYGRISLRKPAQYRRLDRIIRNVIHGLRVKSVSILEAGKNRVSYSTDHQRVGSRVGGGGYAAAQGGKSSSMLIYRGSIFNLLPGSGSISCVLKTYIPLRAERLFGHKSDVVIGVIEVVQDLSEDYRATLKLQAMVSMISIFLLAFLFFVLRFIVGKADRIISARAAERHRLEERLHHSERLAALGKMVASVAHEIKNPLGIVKSSAAILQKKMASLLPEQEHLAVIIVDETARLDRVVREFLDFARPQPFNFSQIDINAVVEKVLGFMAPDLMEKGVAADVDLDRGIPPVRGDFDRLYRAFMNVIINAVQAMENGGVLTVRSRVLADGRVEVEIGDNGQGMTDETVAQIFAPFFTGRSRGTGLGLAIVKNIIDGHEGEIEISSYPGEGSRFRFRLKSGTEA